MTKKLEQYWREIQSSWLDHAFPFNRRIFQRIATDIMGNQYTSAEAIVKHIAEGSGIEPPEFTRLMTERLGKKLCREDALDFLDGYGKLTMLLQAGFFLSAEGPDATEEIMRQWSLSMNGDRFTFLAQNIEAAASLVRQDPTGRTMMMRFADKTTRTSTRTYFNEGVRTAFDTFMAYSKSWEAYLQGDAY